MATTSLYDASYAGDSDKVQDLLRERTNINDNPGQHGYPLHAACLKGSLPTVELLLEHGADVNLRGGFYGYPLQNACMSANNESSVEIVRRLLSRNAVVNAIGG